MRRIVQVRASALRVGDVVRLSLVSVLVQAVYRAKGRVSVITAGGVPVDFEGCEVLTVLRSGKGSRGA